MKTRANDKARIAYDAYCDAGDLDQIERKQDYTITDLITDLLHLADSKGFDVQAIAEMAIEHHRAESEGDDDN